METGEFVKIDYVARVKDTNELFDTTKEDVARKEGMHNEKVKYGPVTFIIGADFVIRGLDDALREMKAGEKKEVEIPPAKAFGEKNEDLVKLMPEAQFKQQNIDIQPGAYININNIRGKIISISGGRVKVDFNHPLAGKTLKYDVEVIGVVTEKPEKVKSIVTYFIGREMTVSVGKEVEIEANADMHRNLKEIIAQTISKWVGIETVKFVDVFKSEKGEEKTDSKGEAESEKESEEQKQKAMTGNEKTEG